MKPLPKPLKVGFDLDGVILYNPARLIRPVIALYKRYISKKPQSKFRIPHKTWEKIALTFLHKSSIFIAPGYRDIERLVKTGQIEAYLITGRFSFLKPDFDRWLKKMNAYHIFKAIHMNEHDEQPHLYKENLIKKYDLDVFVDDNWDIIKHLDQGYRQKQHHASPIWVYNLFDRHLVYKRKQPGLNKVMEFIETTLLNKNAS